MHFLLKAWLHRLALLALSCLPLSASALDNITVLVSGSSPASNEFVERFRTELIQPIDTGLSIKVVTEEDLVSNRVKVSEDSLIVAVGVQALIQASKLDVKRMVLGVLVPQPSFDKTLIESKRSPRNFSAILLDQPFTRQIALIKAIMPAVTSFGVLLGPTSVQSSYLLQQAANSQGLGLLQENIYAASELNAKLRRTLEGSPVLLAVPDPMVYNRETVQTILLTSYRYQKPVIGFSLAYARAGALAAVFSTPQQIARQAAELIKQIVAKPQAGMPLPQTPKYFSVDINRQVARSLGIEVSDENTVSDTLLRIERPLP